MILSGNLANETKAIDPDELLQMTPAPSQHALLFLEPEGDGVVRNGDVALLELRLGAMGISATPVKIANDHVVFEVTGPLPHADQMTRLVNPGHCTLAAIEQSGDWQNLLPEPLHGSIEVTTFPPEVGRLPALTSTDRKTLQEAITVLRRNDLEPFIYQRRGRSPNDSGTRYFLGVLNPASRITNDMWQSVVIEKAEYLGRYNLRLSVNTKGQALLNRLTGDNIGKPLAIVLDGVALSMPIVIEKLSTDSMVASPFITDDSEFSEHVQDVMILNAVLNYGPLGANWKMVHMTTLP